MKAQSIVVEHHQPVAHTEGYLVVQAKNTLTPKVGDWLTPQQMQDIMDAGSLDVTIKPRSY